MNLRNSILFLLLIFLIISCKNSLKLEQISRYKGPEKRITDIIKEQEGIDRLYKNNLINLKNGYPFYIIRMNAPLMLKKPSDNMIIPGEYEILEFGDAVFPLDEVNPTKYFFYVRTIDGIKGWIHTGFGISLNYDEDPNLYYFSDSYYLQKYIDSSGKINNSSKVILAKNIVPILLENFSTQGWFYPPDYQLALRISKYAESIAEHKLTYFYASSSYDWRVHEVVIAKNLLADSYQKLGFLDEAEEIHKYLWRWYFWMRADNTQIGGLNSIVKLEIIYLERLTKEKVGSKRYKELENKIIETVLFVGDKYNKYTIIDPRWHLTAAEWVINILLRSLPREEFYAIAKKIAKRTTSDGYKEMVNIYIAIEMYGEGKKEEALKILTSIKPKKNFKPRLRINDWLSVNKIIPDSIIYQYKF